MANKCICEQYKSCEVDQEQRVSTPAGDISGTEFIERADRICPGTKIFINSRRATETMRIDGDEVTLALDALGLQCEFWVQGEMGG